MRYHDCFLTGYEVRNHGKTILLHLVLPDLKRTQKEPRIEFSEVAAYHFIHTGGAIITDLIELPVPELLLRVGDQLADWWCQHGGYHLWDDSQENYQANLVNSGYRAWTIGSAIGFEGFVIAKAITHNWANNEPAERAGTRAA